MNRPLPQPALNLSEEDEAMNSPVDLSYLFERLGKAALTMQMRYHLARLDELLGRQAAEPAGPTLPYWAGCD